MSEEQEIRFALQVADGTMTRLMTREELGEFITKRGMGGIIWGFSGRPCGTAQVSVDWGGLIEEPEPTTEPEETPAPKRKRKA